MEKIFVTQSSMPPFEEYSAMIKKVWTNYRLTNMGELHQQFEKELKGYLGAERLSLMVNGHMALEMVIAAMGFPKGSEVITTPFTFISTTHAIVRNNLVPVFCDIDSETYMIDVEKIEDLITERTVAILPVHTYGNVCDVERISAIAKKWNLKVIYDAAHAFGVKYKETDIGRFGDASVFSFHATKVFHTIEGGAVAYHNRELDSKLYNLKNFGIRSEDVVAEIGANAKMSEFSAAMGLCNLKYIDQEISKRKHVVELYRHLLLSVPGIKLLEYHKDIQTNYAYFPIQIDAGEYGMTRDGLYEKLKENGIYSRKYFYPLTSDQPCFRNKFRDALLENARHIASHVLTLPLYADLSEENIERICQIISS